MHAGSIPAVASTRIVTRRRLIRLEEIIFEFSLPAGVLIWYERGSTLVDGIPW